MGNVSFPGELDLAMGALHAKGGRKDSSKGAIITNTHAAACWRAVQRTSTCYRSSTAVATILARVDDAGHYTASTAVLVQELLRAQLAACTTSLPASTDCNCAPVAPVELQHF
jgi:hypothetical protein